MDFQAGKVYNYYPEGHAGSVIPFKIASDAEGNMYYENVEDGNRVDIVLMGDVYVEEVEEPNTEQ